MNYFTAEKHYNTITNFYKSKYNKKVAKISLNGGFTCPNKDGKKGYGGCTYCSKYGAGDFAGSPLKSIKEQFNDIKAIMNNKWKDTLYIPYLQANTNTYDTKENLIKKYNELLDLDPNVIGVSISTRPDCIDNDVISVLDDLNKKIPVQVELGLQTVNLNTVKLINRNSTNEEFSLAVKMLRDIGIEVVVHIINGLPYENKDDMLKTIDFLNKHDIQGVKIHSLCILKDTLMGKQYLENPWPILSIEEYVDITVSQIRNLKDSIIIHRLSADFAGTDLIAPIWTRKKMVVMNEIDKVMRKYNYYQGDQFKNGQDS